MIWTVIIFSGVLTFCTRFLPLSKIMPKTLPNFIQGGLGYVSIAVLTPIIINSILIVLFIIFIILSFWFFKKNGINFFILINYYFQEFYFNLIMIINDYE